MIDNRKTVVHQHVVQQYVRYLHRISYRIYHVFSNVLVSTDVRHIRTKSTSSLLSRSRNLSRHSEKEGDVRPIYDELQELACNSMSARIRIDISYLHAA